MRTSFAVLLVSLAIAGIFGASLRRMDASPCNDIKSESACHADKADKCEWCLSRAVPSICVSQEQTKLLPPGVFVCSNTTEAAITPSTCASVSDVSDCGRANGCHWCVRPAQETGFCSDTVVHDDSSVLCF